MKKLNINLALAFIALIRASYGWHWLDAESWPHRCASYWYRVEARVQSDVINRQSLHKQECNVEDWKLSSRVNVLMLRSISLLSLWSGAQGP